MYIHELTKIRRRKKGQHRVGGKKQQTNLLHITNELVTYNKGNLCIELQMMIHLKEHNEFMFRHKTFQDRE
jgi:hypothetical protein